MYYTLRTRLFTVVISLFFLTLIAQDQSTKTQNRKGEFYIYWGWNFSSYTDSDITFKGDTYNFTLNNVEAGDRPSPFSISKYFGAGTLTKPQYNFRIGYFFNDTYNISIGVDHMKYVVNQGQIATISGFINDTGTIYDGIYTDDPILISPFFLQYEHTDGLNYGNIGLRRLDHITDIKPIALNLLTGVEAGILYPKTNTFLIGNERYDKYHISGYAINLVAGANIEFLKYFFIQSELKGGYINLPNVRTTQSTSDSAKQDFFFFQWNFVFGAHFKI